MNRDIDHGIGNNSKQRGSILIVTLISILSVGAVAAGTNALLTQNTVTANEKTRTLQGTSVADSILLLERDNRMTPAARSALEEEYLYSDRTQVEVIAQPNHSENFKHNGYIKISTAEYGYSIKAPSAADFIDIKNESDLYQAAPGLKNAIINDECELKEFEDDKIKIKCDKKNADVSFKKPWLINGGEREVKIEMKDLKSVGFTKGIHAKGEKVELKIEGISNDIIFGGPIILDGKDDEAKAKFKLEDSGSLNIDGGVSIKGEYAELKTENIEGAININGALILDGKEDEAKAEFKFDGTAPLDITGGVLIEGQKADLKVEDIEDSINIGGPVVLNGRGDEADAKFKFSEPGSINITQAVLIEGEKADFKVEKLEGAAIIGGPLTVDGRDDEAKVEFKFEGSGSLEISEKVLIEGEKAELKVKDVEGPVTIDGPVTVNGKGDEAKAHFKFDESGSLDVALGMLVEGKKAELKVENNKVVAGSKKTIGFGGPVVLDGQGDEGKIKIQSMENEKTTFVDDVYVYGSPSKFELKNLDEHDIIFERNVFFKPNTLKIELKGKSKKLKIGRESERADYSPEEEKALEDFPALKKTTAADIRSKADKLKSVTSTLSELEQKITDPIITSSGGNVERRQVE